MTSTQRPDIWVGHVDMRTARLKESNAFMEQAGLRPIIQNSEVAVLEFRGGTHIVLFQDDNAEAADARFDFMVEDLDATYARFQDLGLPVSEIKTSRVHRSFVVTEPGGNRIVVNSTHVEDHSQV